jgi:hypothetical protein
VDDNGTGRVLTFSGVLAMTSKAGA